MKKYIWQIVLFLIIAAIMASCRGYYAGTYRVKSLDGDTATFRGMVGKYLIDGKKYKIGQKIHFHRTIDSTKVNVVRIK